MAWFLNAFFVDPAFRGCLSFDLATTKAFRDPLFKLVFNSGSSLPSILAEKAFTFYPGSARALEPGDGFGAAGGDRHSAIESSNHSPDD